MRIPAPPYRRLDRRPGDVFNGKDQAEAAGSIDPGAFRLNERGSNSVITGLPLPIPLSMPPRKKRGRPIGRPLSSNLRQSD